MPDPSPVRPWYREPWMLFVLGLPALVVVASLITLWIAIENRDTLVIDAAPRDGTPRHSMPATKGN